MASDGKLSHSGHFRDGLPSRGGRTSNAVMDRWIDPPRDVRFSRGTSDERGQRKCSPPSSRKSVSPVREIGSTRNLIASLPGGGHFSAEQSRKLRSRRGGRVRGVLVIVFFFFWGEGREESELRKGSFLRAGRLAGDGRCPVVVVGIFDKDGNEERLQEL